MRDISFQIWVPLYLGEPRCELATRARGDMPRLTQLDVSRVVFEERDARSPSSRRVDDRRLTSHGGCLPKSLRTRPHAKRRPMAVSPLITSHKDSRMMRYVLQRLYREWCWSSVPTARQSWRSGVTFTLHERSSSGSQRGASRR